MALRGSFGGEWGTNLARVKGYNEVVVFDLVRTEGPIGRAAIAAATGLTLQTVSNIVRRLITSGAVTEADVTPSTRPRRALRVNPDAGFALGIQLVRTGLVVGVVDLAGTVRGRAETRFAYEEPPGPVLERLDGLVASAVDAAGIAREQLLGAGIGAPGPLELRTGVLLNVLNPPSWSHFPMREALSERLGMEVILDNDATAAAMGERWRGAGAGVEHFIYAYLGTGLLLGGQPYRGLRGNAGEAAHIQVDPAGPVCECGRNGCLGLYVSPTGLMREAQRVILEAPATAPVLERPESPEALLRCEDPRLRAVVTRAGRLLGRVMAQMSRVLDPELIVLGGPLANLLGDEVAWPVREELAQLDEPGAPPPRVELSRIGSDAGVIGAATLVLHDLYAPSSRKLSLAATEGRRRAGRPAA
jgi:predicted NBD/HSP70 family sugar kinase